MDSLERTQIVLSGGIPDRVPVDLHNFLVTARLMGAANFADFFHDGDAMAEGQIQAWRRYGHDVLILENGTAALAQACGVQVIYQSDTAPVAKEPAIRSLDEVSRLRVPDPHSDPLLKELLKLTRRVVREISDKAFIIGRGDQGPFSLACEIRGMENFMMDIALAEQPEQIHQLLDFCRQVTTRFCLAQVEAGAHATSIGDSPSGPDLLSPRAYRKYAYPYVRQLVEDLHRQGVRVAYHICGNSTPIITEMVSSGADILEIDQKADQKTCKAAAMFSSVSGPADQAAAASSGVSSLAFRAAATSSGVSSPADRAAAASSGGQSPACRAAAFRKTTLLGPIDPGEIMARGTPEQVTEKCREAIENLASGGGFILGPGCALPATTPDDNIHAMIEAARCFGAYHISTAFSSPRGVR